ncbi:hypothetical protein B0H16DRAFT_1464822 [Mycena metata]|uniref:Uncharacterized protein n=1 Tax=Mycena metata TaxID=1033252 RepID=A0AAD7IDG0_9AGAR|nr:hypothetical protein B0H16DRAFT_1464822 [Mycena metata]
MDGLHPGGPPLPFFPPALMIPDLLPLELWHEIAANAAQHAGTLHLKSWLAIAPGTAARHMHDAAFAILFRDVRLGLDHDTPARALAKLTRILHNEQCVEVIRSLEVYATFPEEKGWKYKDTGNELERALANALPRFPLLRKFAWDKAFIPLPPTILRTLLSANKQLEILNIGLVCPDTPQIDLAGLSELVDLQLDYQELVEPGSTEILFPKSLHSLSLSSPGIRGISSFENFANHAVSLNAVSLDGMVIKSDFWSSQSPYTALHTVCLTSITPPNDTGLDFRGIDSLDTLILRRIEDIQDIGSLSLCIRTPSTLRNLEISHVSAASGDTSVILGINIVALHSLDLTAVSLFSEDLGAMFFGEGNTPATPAVRKLRLCELDMEALVVMLKSSPPLPTLHDLEFRLSNEEGVSITDFTEALASFLDHAVPALQSLVLDIQVSEWSARGEWDDLAYDELEDAFIDPILLSALRTTGHLQHITLPIWNLTLDHPIFHELGDALLHVPALSLRCESWNRHETVAYRFTPNEFQALSKFTGLRDLQISDRGGTGERLGRADVENLSRHVPTLRTFTAHGETWQIFRDAVGGDFRTAVRVA